MTGPTGRQFEINSGAMSAIITERGATLRKFTSHGHRYTETFAEDQEPPMGCGNILVPWPNRTAGASWKFNGEAQHLDVTEPARDNAIHGLVRKKPWELIDHLEDRVELAVDIPAEHGWPVPLRTEIRYQLTDSGLMITHTVHNRGDVEVPFGVGAHPYLRAPSHDDVVVRLAAELHQPLDERTMIPVGEPEPSRYTGPVRLSDLDLDDAFTGLVTDSDGRSRHSILGSDGGVQLWADEDFRWLQVFTPTEFNGRDGKVIALEPMTCPPNALNSGVDLLTVAAGETWRGSWGIRPIPAG
jgi:aldose 1-epimerase